MRALVDAIVHLLHDRVPRRLHPRHARRTTYQPLRDEVLLRGLR